MAWKANGKADLPIADRAMAWDADAAEARVRKWAGGEDNMDWPKYRKAFFAYDDERPEEFGGYKLPFADVVDGELKAVPRGIMAVAAVLQGGHGGTDLPADVQNEIRDRVAAYYHKWDEDAPWERKSAPAIREGRVLSEKNRKLVEAAIQQSKEAIAALQALLDAAALPSEERRSVVQELMTVRSLGGNRVGGYGIVWGGRDLYGTYFTPATETWRDRYPAPPVLYDHGFDEKLGKRPIGKVIERRRDDIGEWIEAQLEVHEQYRQALAQLMEAGALGWSTGSAKHLVEVADDGEIKQWPVVEVSLTPAPAEPRTLGVHELRSLGLRVPGLDDAEAAPSGAGRSLPEAEQPEDEKTTQVQGDEQMADEIKTGEVQAPAPQVNLDELAAKVAERLAPTVKGAIATPAVIKKSGLGDSPVKAFLHWARTGDIGAVKTAVVWDEANDTQGAVTVPDDFYNQIIMKAHEQSIPRKMGAMVITTSRDVVRVPTEGTPLAKFALTAEESGSYDETAVEPFGGGDVTVYKLTRLVKVTNELLEDSAFNLEQILSGMFADAIALTENYYALRGTGSGQPEGVLAGGTLGKTFASASTIAAAEVMDLYYALSSVYRSNPTVAWVMADGTEKVIRKIQATSSAGEFLFQVTPAGVIDPNSLLGKPVFNSSQMPDIAASAKTIVIGDWSKFVIVERTGMTVSRNPYLYQANDITGFFAKIRLGMKVAQAEAFQYGQHPTA